MDIFVSSAYLCTIMIARFVTMLAVLAITVATTVSSAHAARMSIVPGPDHATHVGAMMHAPDIAQLACGDEQHCGSADAEMCKFACASLSAFLTSPGADSEQAHRTASHASPTEASLVGCAPGLNERPPKLRLL